MHCESKCMGNLGPHCHPQTSARCMHVCSEDLLSSVVSGICTMRTMCATTRYSSKCSQEQHVCHVIVDDTLPLNVGGCFCNYDTHASVLQRSSSAATE